MMHFANVLIVVIWLCVKSDGKCPTTIDDNTLAFTKNLSSIAYVRTGQEQTFECCARGFDHIYWNFKATNSSSWIAYPFGHMQCSVCDNDVNLYDRNQTLEIKKSGTPDDGVYKCVPTNLTTGLSIQHSTRLQVYDCTDRGKPLPLPPHDVLTRVHENATFKCGGDFGCKDSGLKSIDWMIGDKYVDELHHHRYKIVTENRDGKTVLMTFFTISNVQPSDFELNYTCTVTSDYIGGNSAFVVHLKDIDSRDIIVFPTKYIILTAVASFMLIVVIVYGVTHQMYGPQIKFYFKSRVSCTSLKDKGDKRYHVFICHSEEDQEALETINAIIEGLTSRGYSVASMREDEILGGQNRLYAAMDLLEQSASVLYIESSITEEYERIAENVNASISPRFISLVLTTKKKHNIFYKHKAFQNLVTMQWPGNTSNSRSLGNFYCSVQLRLPSLSNKSNHVGSEESGRLLPEFSRTTSQTPDV